jgi:hypothetical protein
MTHSLTSKVVFLDGGFYGRHLRNMLYYKTSTTYEDVAGRIGARGTQDYYLRYWTTGDTPFCVFDYQDEAGFDSDNNRDDAYVKHLGNVKHRAWGIFVAMGVLYAGETVTMGGKLQPQNGTGKLLAYVNGPGVGFALETKTASGGADCDIAYLWCPSVFTSTEGVTMHTAATAPTVGDDSGDGYIVGDMWYDTVTEYFYVAVDVTAGAAVWEPILTLDSAGDLTLATANLNLTAGDVTVDAGDITATAGDIVASAGALEAGTTVTAGTGVTATTGGVTATAGGVTATAGDITAVADDIVATAGDIYATAGDIYATAGDIYTSAGLIRSATRIYAGQVTLADGETNIDCSLGNTFVTQANTNPTAISTLTNGVAGQEITIIGGNDGNATTIADGGNFALNTVAGTMTLQAENTIKLVLRSATTAAEISRSLNHA